MLDGEIMNANLALPGLSKDWVLGLFEKHNITSEKKVLLATYSNAKLLIALKNRDSHVLDALG